MAEKTTKENPLPREQIEPDKLNDMAKPTDTAKIADTAKLAETAKPADKTMPLPTALPCTPGLSVPSFTKTPPNDLYRRLLPAVLFVLTFVTVMTMLLIYMDTVALGAQQFRLNMSRDYELARIPQESPPLVAFVRQLHLAPAPRRPPPAPPAPPQLAVLDSILGELYNGTFVEFLPFGGRGALALYLQAARSWRGVVARAAPRDYLRLRPAARAAHACLSAAPHPREVTYREDGFVSRVLCLPLYTLLLAADAARAHYVLLGGQAVLPALAHVPYSRVRLQVIEVRATDPEARNKTTAFLATKNYTVAATYDESIMYALQD